MISVVHSELVTNLSRSANAQKHNITKRLCDRVIKAAKRDKSFLTERQKKEDDRQSLIEKVQEEALAQQRMFGGVLSAASLLNQL